MQRYVACAALVAALVTGCSGDDSTPGDGGIDVARDTRAGGDTPDAPPPDAASPDTARPVDAADVQPVDSTAEVRGDAVAPPDAPDAATPSADGPPAIRTLPASPCGFFGPGLVTAAVALNRQTLAFGNAQGFVKLFRGSDGAELPGALSGHRGPITALGTAAAGTLLATASADGEARVWSVADARTVRTVSPHGGTPIVAVAISPDGKLLATGGQDGAVVVSDVASGVSRARLEGHQKGVTSLAFFADGAQLLSGSVDATARVWNVATGTEVRRLDAGGPVNEVAADPKGLAIAAATSAATVKLWNADGSERTGLVGVKAPVWSVVFAADGETMVTSGADGVTIWRVRDGFIVNRFGVNGTSGMESVRAYALPDAEVFVARATQSEGTLEVRGLADGAVKGNIDALTGVGTFSPMGTLLAAPANRQTIRVFETATGRFRYETPGEMAAFAPDDARLVTVSRAGGFRLFAADSGAKTADLNVGLWMRDRYLPNDVAVSSDGARLLFTCRYIDSGDYSCVDPKTGPAVGIAAYTFADGSTAALTPVGGAGRLAQSADATKIASGYFQYANRNPGPSILGIMNMVLDPYTSESLAYADATPAPVAFSPAGDALAFGYFGVAIYDAATELRFRLATGRFGPEMWNLEASPDGRSLLALPLRGREGELPVTIVRQDARGTAVLFVPGVHQAVLGPTGALLAARRADARVHAIEVWDVGAYARLRSIDLDRTLTRIPVSLSADGRRLLTAGPNANDAPTVIDTMSGATLATLAGASGPMVLSPDGALVITAGGGVLRRWKVGGSDAPEPGPPIGAVTSLAISQDGTKVALLDAKTLQIRRVGDATLQKEIPFEAVASVERLFDNPFSVDPGSISFSSDGSTVAARNGGRYGHWRVADWAPLAAGTSAASVSVYPWAVVPDDGTVVTFERGTRTLIVRKMSDYTPVRRIRSHAAGIQDVAFTADGVHLATASSDRIQLTRKEDGIIVEGVDLSVAASPGQPQGWPTAIRLSRDARRAALYDRGGVALWCRP